MSAEFPSLGDVVRKHRLVEYLTGQPIHCQCGWTSPEEYCTRTDHPEHIEQMWADACTLTSVDQLDALPFLTIVREIYGPSPGSGTDYGAVWERRSSAWHAIAGSVMLPGYNHPRLRARLIWHPDWSQQ